MLSAIPFSRLMLPLRGAPLRLLGIALVLAPCGQTARAQCRLPKQGAAAESAKSLKSSSPAGEPLLPESGLLTNTAYTNLYFGFEMQLPIPLEGHRIMLPIRLPGEHALLGIGFQDGKRYGTLVITAGGRRDEGSPNMTPEEEQQRLDDIARGKPGPGPMERLDYTPPPVKLKRVDKHAGDVHGSQFSARIKDYAVRFTVQTNDKSFLGQARKSIESLQYFCADTSGNFFTTEGKPFTPPGSYTIGPTIPTSTVDEAIRVRPAKQTIPSSGYFAAGQYRLPQLDFSYTLPPGWRMTGAKPDSADPSDDPAVAQRLDFLWQACARTLFRASSPRTSGQSGGTAELELKALDQQCLGLPAPNSATDWFGAESLGEYLQMLGRFGKIKSDRLAESGGHVFAAYRGTIANGPPAHELEKRAAQVIVATRYRKLILVWRWSAPTEADLRAVPSSTLSLAGAPAIPLGPAMATPK